MMLVRRAIRLAKMFFSLTPKWHMFVHFVARMARQGNGRSYATWLDESTNKLLKKCCRHVSQWNFEASVYTRIAHALERGKKRFRTSF